jgi:hypothetical protein
MALAWAAARCGWWRQHGQRKAAGWCEASVLVGSGGADRESGWWCGAATLVVGSDGGQGSLDLDGCGTSILLLF